MKKVVLMLAFMFAKAAWGGSAGGYEFISPLPGSEANTLESTIIIREGAAIASGTLTQDAVTVWGSESGEVYGRLILSSDEKTLIFKPSQLFAPGERVQVTIHPGILTLSGRPLPAYQFSFGVASFSGTPNPYEYIPALRPDQDEEPDAMRKRSSDPVPDNFPEIKVEVYDSTAIGDGYIYLSVSSEVEGVGYYLMVLNNDGSPLFARELEHDYAYDFKLQPNGLLSYAHFFEHHSYTGGGNVVHKIMDRSVTVIDSVQMGNGYVAEAHDFQMLPNGHYLLFGYYLTPVDMSVIAPGGRPDALVSGGVVQELDAEKNVVFQWRSWDHYSFEDWPFTDRQATSQVISLFHLNAISQDDDGHILLGTPQWAKKINRQTGEVMWNLGGEDNEFSFIGVDSTEGVGMVGGHTFYRLPNGNVLLYDNGNRQGTRSSRVNEFRLDEENRTAELVWTYVPDTLVAGWHRGSAQRLPNGNTVIGWGGSSGKPSPAFTEVNAAGEKVYELSFVPPDVESYRAFRLPFTSTEPASEVVITEVAPGNSYVFAGEKDTGVTVEINTLEGDGYNELSVAAYNYAPLYPEFPGKAPRVMPARMVLGNFAINGIDADVSFDVGRWRIKDPENTLVYHREFEGKGLFVPLATTYNPATQKLVANTRKFGEFILATPDFASVVFTPQPFAPVHPGSVNQAKPVALRWTPVGYVTSYALQVSHDSLFSELVVDEAFLTEALYTLENVEENAAYYWRVKASNDAGVSDWSPVQRFVTALPFVSLSAPGAGAAWQRGLKYYIRWADNLEEDVVLELYRNGDLVDTLAVTESDGAFEWEVGLDLPLGTGYTIQIRSSLDETIADRSAQPFTIMDATGVSVEAQGEVIREYALHQNYPNPFNPATTIRFDLPVDSEVRLTVYDAVGREVITLVDGRRSAGAHAVVFDASQLPSGLYVYRLRTSSFTRTQKMMLVK